MTRVSDHAARNAHANTSRVPPPANSANAASVPSTPGPAGLHPEPLGNPSRANTQTAGRSVLIQTQLRARAAALQARSAHQTLPHSRADYLAGWQAWAQEPGHQNERRHEAVRRMLHWLDENNHETPLGLNGLDLTSLPSHLPAGLLHLNVSFNQLSTLPGTLPTELRTIDAFQSQLTTLPQNLPPGLRSLNVEGNQLTHLPSHLPAQLRELNASFNQLISLPECLPSELQVFNASFNQLRSLPNNLPPSLRWLNIVQNQLTSLPENITHQMGPYGHILLERNPLPQRVLQNLETVISQSHYQGPYIHFSMGSDSHTEVVRPLPDAIGAWYEPADQAAVKQTWAHLLDGLAPERLAELGVPQFSTFLDHLQNTVYNRADTHDPVARQNFRQATMQWLSHLAVNPALREQTFWISQEASTSCEDRVSLFLNAMKKARVAADVHSGLYDTKLPELIHLAKGMFRIDQLEVIARKKAATLRFVDEIEVYLAYQVKLRASLELPLDTPEMRYFETAHVTQEDLDEAEKQVKSTENEHFIHYLSTDWQPWQAVLERLDPMSYRQARDHLITALSEGFSSTLASRLQAMGLGGDPDAQRTLGVQLKTEITHEINGQLTQKFLAQNGLAHLLSQGGH